MNINHLENENNENTTNHTNQENSFSQEKLLQEIFNQNLSDKDKIISFLKSVISLLERDECSSGQYKAITEFYISFFFQHMLDNNNKNEDINYTEKELQSFLSLGWYIYSFLLKKI